MEHGMIENNRTEMEAALFQERRLKEAENKLVLALMEQPENNEIINNLGVIHFISGEARKAEICFLKALMIKGDDQDALINLAHLYRSLSAWEDSKIQLEKLVLKDDTDIKILNELGMIYLEMGAIENARLVIERSLCLDPSQEVVRESMTGLITALSRERVSAEQTFERMKEKWVSAYDYKDGTFGDSEKDRLYRRVYYRHENLEPYNEKYSVMNPGSRIALITLYTPNVKNYGIQAELNFKSYANQHDYTFYVYRDSIDPENQSLGAFQKPIALLRHIRDHEYIIWLDSDLLIVDTEYSFETIIEKKSEKDLLVCADPFFYLNTGVLIVKNTPYSTNLLKEWYEISFSEGTDLFTMKNQADQPHLIKLLTHKDKRQDHHHVFPANEFNSHPKVYVDGDFIIHFMGYSEFLRTQLMAEINNRLIG